MNSGQVIIVGAGLAGIITAILLSHKVRNLAFRIYDKNSKVVCLRTGLMTYCVEFSQRWSADQYPEREEPGLKILILVSVAMFRPIAIV